MYRILFKESIKRDYENLYSWTYELGLDHADLIDKQILHFREHILNDFIRAQHAHKERELSKYLADADSQEEEDEDDDEDDGGETPPLLN